MSRPRQDASRGPGAPCGWCGDPIPERTESGRKTRDDAEVCGVVCRKRRHRWKEAIRPADQVAIRPRDPRDASRVDRPMRFAYADPPYPGKAGYYVERQEVDHAELIARLEREYPDGWALSTSAAALPAVLRICPLGVRVCVWRRQVRRTRSARALNAWEPLLVAGGRPLPTADPQDLVDHLDYRGRFDAFPGALVGMKPPQFAEWLFRLLGARPTDALDDLYPGSGAIGRAWEVYASSGAGADASPVDAAGSAA